MAEQLTIFNSDTEASRLEIELSNGETKRNFETMSKDQLVAHSLMVRRWQIEMYWKLRRKS
jgi:hypothetical protein